MVVMVIVDGGSSSDERGGGIDAYVVVAAAVLVSVGLTPKIYSYLAFTFQQSNSDHFTRLQNVRRYSFERRQGHLISALWVGIRRVRKNEGNHF